MSAIEQMPHPTTPADRRREERIRLDRILAARVGRHDGVILDLSSRGVRVRHSGTLLRGATMRITFDWGGQKFVASAEVLSSRVVMLGANEGESAAYETRFRFSGLESGARELLDRVLATIANEELRTWVGNLKGFDDPLRSATLPHAKGFIRCRRVGNSWEKKWTRSRTQPADGFVLPAGMPASDVEALCRAWVGMDAEGRQLLRRTAEAVLDEAVGAGVR